MAITKKQSRYSNPTQSEINVCAKFVILEFYL